MYRYRINKLISDSSFSLARERIYDRNYTVFHKERWTKHVRVSKIVIQYLVLISRGFHSGSSAVAGIQYLYHRFMHTYAAEEKRDTMKYIFRPDI